MLGLRLRSLFFNVGWYVGSTIIAIVGMPILLLPRAANIAWANVWIDFCLWWVKVTCRITHRVNGLENRPAGPVILACKHQSSWETLAFHRLFPNAATVLKRELLFIPVVGWAMARAGNIAVERGDGPKALRSLLRQAKATVLKRELLYIPVVGWAMARAGNIAVERGDGPKALRSLLRQAKAAVAEGRSILIYPEGTRTPVGASLPYHAGTAALYRQLGVPVVPVALNSGVFWGRRKFIKWPGIIEVEILPPIPPGLGRETFMATLRERIEGTTQRLVADAKRLP